MLPTLRRSAACAVVLILAVSGCGISLRTPAAPEPTTSGVPLTTGVVDVPPVSAAPLMLQPGQTVVTLTFDDGRGSQAAAATLMAAQGLRGSFFVNSGTVGTPGYLTLAELHTMASAGHEIGGHTVAHANLNDITPDEIRREICDDRSTLLSWGFPVRNFAYPYGTARPEDRNIVGECGYNSARSLGQLRPVIPVDAPEELSCALCDVTETVPPAEPLFTRAPGQVRNNWTTADLEREVTDAIAIGGWLQLTFHDICNAECSEIGFPAAEFEKFVTWLAGQQAAGAVLVRPVGDVIGGPVAPAVAGPVVPPAPFGTNGVLNPGLEDVVNGVPQCWIEGGFGDNSREFSLVPTAHSGAVAGRLVVRDYGDGDAKLLQKTDLGSCAPSVSPGTAYKLEAWYTSTVPTSFTVQYRLPHGVWTYGVSSPDFAAASEFTRAEWTLPPPPPGVTAISFGLTLTQDGELVTDDYALVAQDAAAPR